MNLTISCDFTNELLHKSLQQHKELLFELAEYLHCFEEFKRKGDSFCSSQLTYNSDIWVRTLTPSELINLIAWLIAKIGEMGNNS